MGTELVTSFLRRTDQQLRKGENERLSRLLGKKWTSKDVSVSLGCSIVIRVTEDLTCSLLQAHDTITSLQK